ncbi:MAG: metallophosphoesterase [Candidatus Sifarchaeia archaeon]
MTSSNRRDILKLLIESGLQVAPEALEYILHLDTPIETIRSILIENSSGKHPLVLSLSYVESLIEGRITETIHEDQKQVTVNKFEGAQIEPLIPVSITENETGWSFRIEKNPDADQVGSEGTVENFLALFRDRFNRIKRIYMSRIDTQNAVSPHIAKLRKDSAKQRRAMTREGMRISSRTTQTVLGIVRNKSISQSRNVIVELENLEIVCKECDRPLNLDLNTKPMPELIFCPSCNIKVQHRERYSTMICIVPATREGLIGQQLSEKANSLLPDEITCISGFVDEDARMIADDVIFPDIPTVREIGRARRDVYAVFISDIHCGSKEFLEDEFDRFTRWINGKDVDEEDKALVKQIRYLFVAGDMVDGISVYPAQRNDLKIESIYEQYLLFASKLNKLPHQIKIFCIPGNHDANRQALPKPPIPEEFAQPLYNLGNRISMLGDPSQVIVEGVNVLLTHGDSMDDLVTSIPGASYTEPARPMIELLKKRHLVPMYGGKTELAPLHRDWMVIDTPPDIVHFGHCHHNAVDNYRGVQIINSGTFQSQTDFMRKQGVVPTPGIVTLMNLRTGAPDVRFFYDMSKK